MRQNAAAENSFVKAVAIAPENMQYLSALARLYLAEKRYDQAAELAEKMTITDPTNPVGRQLLEYIREK